MVAVEDLPWWLFESEKKNDFLSHFGETHILNLASTNVPGYVLVYIEKHVEFNGIICSGEVGTMELAKRTQSLNLALRSARFINLALWSARFWIGVNTRGHVVYCIVD